jgi:hypothetical protein
MRETPPQGLPRHHPGCLPGVPKRRDSVCQIRLEREDRGQQGRRGIQCQLCLRMHMAEVAQNLYSALHKMDASCFDLIIVKKLPETDLGIAINEKLYRAAVI